MPEVEVFTVGRGSLTPPPFGTLNNSSGSSPFIERGFRDGKNEGPFVDEKLKGEKDADIIWKFDIMEEVGSLPHNMANSSPVSFGDLVYVGTSNGQDESHVNIPSPKAPSIIAVNKKTGLP